MRFSLLAGTVLLGSGSLAFLQPPRVEVDHIFLVVQPGAVSEAAALRKAGFTVSDRVTRHEGQGTASVSAIFQNMYLELLWVDSSVSLNPENKLDAQHFRRAADWRNSGVSPFGVGLRKSADSVTLGLPGKSYSAPWMRPGTAIELLRQNPEELDLFVVPGYMSLPQWISVMADKYPSLLSHPSGVRMVSMITLHGTAKHRPRALDVLELPSFTFREGETPHLELEFDRGRQGETIDLRPQLPLLIRR
jgi:hypothetical protein